MSKRVFIGVGHGGADPGAVGYVREADANLTIALELKRLLEAAGVTVGISRTKDEDDPLTEEIREANAFKPDFAIDVHNNAGGGDGFEAYVQTGTHAAESKAAGQAIEKYVTAMGQNSRGIKTKLNSQGKDYFGFLRQINYPAVIVEGFFVDNAKDSADFDTVAEQKKLAAAYAAGILEHLGVEDKLKTATFDVGLRVLKKGCTGEDVKALQILLIGNGYSCGNSGVDGSFGPATDTALRNYQEDHGLAVDGSAGPATMTSLLGAV